MRITVGIRLLVILLVFPIGLVASCSPEKEGESAKTEESTPPSEPPTPILVSFAAASTGETLSVRVAPDYPVPALLVLSNYIVDTCKPDPNATLDHPIVLGALEATIGPTKVEVPRTKLDERTKDGLAVLEARGWELTVTMSTRFGPMRLVQGGPERFGWAYADDAKFLPMNMYPPIPSQTRSIPHATQLLAGRFAHILTAYRIRTAILNNRQQAAPEKEPAEQSRAREEALVREWAEKIRDHLDLSTDGRCDPASVTTMPPEPLPAPPSSS